MESNDKPRNLVSSLPEPHVKQEVDLETACSDMTMTEEKRNSEVISTHKSIKEEIPELPSIKEEQTCTNTVCSTIKSEVVVDPSLEVYDSEIPRLVKTEVHDQKLNIGHNSVTNNPCDQTCETSYTLDSQNTSTDSTKLSETVSILPDHLEQTLFLSASGATLDDEQELSQKENIHISGTTEHDTDDKLSHGDNKSAFKRHNIIPIKEKPYQCEICSKTFSLKCRLKEHQKIHTDIKAYKCEICQKLFKHKNNLNQHQKLHSKIKPYTCEICQKSFTQKSNLNKHQNIHSNRKPYNCEICQKSFTQKSHLSEHQKVHSKIKPYTCDLCNKSFTSKRYLTDHLNIHSNIKPYQCEICQKSFTSWYNLFAHQVTHSKIKSFMCKICQTSFSFRASLTRHQKRH